MKSLMDQLIDRDAPTSDSLKMDAVLVMCHGRLLDWTMAVSGNEEKLLKRMVDLEWRVAYAKKKLAEAGLSLEEYWVPHG